jgi:hypothetical protein
MFYIPKNKYNFKLKNAANSLNDIGKNFVLFIELNLLCHALHSIFCLFFVKTNFHFTILMFYTL